MTIRQFNFTGSNAEATGIITLNGVEVLNGAFSGSSVFGTIFSGSVDIDDALAVGNIISVPTSITITSGQVGIGLTEFNYRIVPNPVFTAEEHAVVSEPYGAFTGKLPIYVSRANPPLSAEDQDFILNTNRDDPTQVQAHRDLLDLHNIRFAVQDPSQFSFGVTEEIVLCNRANVLVNGVEPVNANSNQSVYLSAGDVMTYTTLVFASNMYPTLSL